MVNKILCSTWLYVYCVETPVRHTMNIQPRTTHNIINHRPKSARNSAGTEELPADGTHVPKHVGATE
jgi:hypothetical protein